MEPGSSLRPSELIAMTMIASCHCLCLTLGQQCVCVCMCVCVCVCVCEMHVHVLIYILVHTMCTCVEMLGHKCPPRNHAPYPLAAAKSCAYLLFHGAVQRRGEDPVPQHSSQGAPSFLASEPRPSASPRLVQHSLETVLCGRLSGSDIRNT
jgi:hypothetical protein